MFQCEAMCKEFRQYLFTVVRDEDPHIYIFTVWDDVTLAKIAWNYIYLQEITEFIITISHFLVLHCSSS